MTELFIAYLLGVFTAIAVIRLVMAIAQNGVKTMTKQKFKKYRKIPVTIEAYQTDKEMEIKTLEGTMKANKGDWIIKGVKGELYPCKPDVFEMTYEKVNDND